jgi:hypothetical protein
LKHTAPKARDLCLKYFCAGTYGKFEPNQPVDVPIWLAIELRKRNQCDIKLPPWMALTELKDLVRKERTDMSTFQPLPFHYVEVLPPAGLTETNPVLLAGSKLLLFLYNQTT